MLNVEFLRFANESFCLGIDESDGKEDEMIDAGYMWEQASNH